MRNKMKASRRRSCGPPGSCAGRWALLRRRTARPAALQSPATPRRTMLNYSGSFWCTGRRGVAACLHGSPATTLLHVVVSLLATLIPFSVLVSYLEDVLHDPTTISSQPFPLLQLVHAQEVPWFVDYDCRQKTHKKSVAKGLVWSDWIGVIDKVTREGMGLYVDVLTSISAPFINTIDAALDSNWDLRFPLGDECALGMLFYYSIRLHWCLTQVRDAHGGANSGVEQVLDQIAAGSSDDSDVTGEGQQALLSRREAEERHCWVMSDAEGQMIEMYARWPMRVVLASKWPFVLFLMHDEIIRNASIARFWRQDDYINCKGFTNSLDPEVAERHRAALAKNPLRSKTFYLESRQYTNTTGNFSSLLDYFYDHRRNEPIPLSDVDWHDGVYKFIYQKDSDTDIESCPHAFSFLILLRMQMCMLTESAYFVEREYNYAIMLRRLEMGDLIFSKWPHFTMLWSLKGTVRHDFLLGLHLHELLDSRSFVQEVSMQNLIAELNAKAVPVDGDILLEKSLVNRKKTVRAFTSSEKIIAEVEKAKDEKEKTDRCCAGDAGAVQFLSDQFLEAPVMERGIVVREDDHGKEPSTASTGVANTAFSSPPEQNEVAALSALIPLGAPPATETDDPAHSTMKIINQPEEQLTIRQKLWGGEFPLADSLRYLSQRGSELHRAVFSSLMKLPDVWWDGNRKNEFVTTYNKKLNLNLDVADLPRIGFAYTVMVWGEKFSRYLKNFMLRFKQTVQKNNLLVFAMDKTAFHECKKAYKTIWLAEERVNPGIPVYRRKRKEGEEDEEESSRAPPLSEEEETSSIDAPACVYGEARTIVSKFTIPLLLAKYGIDSLWIDFDVYFVQDPTPHLFESAKSLRPMNKNGVADDPVPRIESIEAPAKAEGEKTEVESRTIKPQPLEILITGSFASHCICNGVVYFRATDAVIAWLIDVISWMYSHPYEHDQKCFAHWLDHTERVTFRPLPRSTKVPQWALLDSVQKFVTAAVVEGNGWMGKIENIVLFHWLHGDSDGAGTSGEWLRNSDFYKNYLAQLGGGGENDEQGRKDITMMDIFFGDQDSKIASETMKTKALQASEQFERKMLLTETQHCGVMAELVSEHVELQENLADKDKLIL
ncbi:unnamed protein product [Amoebophrya sp. A120]|nr:unnamed protein product [Amoebophrya sp. A120]|eukprot:GSA120T00001185001.1